MQDPELAALSAMFSDHKIHEERWQESIASDIKDIKEMLRPMSADVAEHTIVLYGVSPEKNNGLNSDIKALKKWRETVDARYMKMVAVLFAIQLIFNLGGFLLAKEGFFKHADAKEVVAPSQVTPGR